jgi:hypothetical protein
MERRSYATFKQLWPEKDVVVTSPRVSLDAYLESHSHTGLSTDEVISIMVGDLQRIRLYPDKGFQIPQEIPDDVWSAFEALVHAGYDKHLVEEHERISSEPARPTSRGSRARRATDPAARGG